MLKSGIPIYVDPIGLQEAEKSMTSPVKRPSPVNRLTLGEQLRNVLGPLGLGYVVKDGFLMVTSKESLDVETGDAINPYLNIAMSCDSGYEHRSHFTRSQPALAGHRFPVLRW